MHSVTSLKYFLRHVFSFSIFLLNYFVSSFIDDFSSNYFDRKTKLKKGNTQMELQNLFFAQANERLFEFKDKLTDGW